MKVSQSHNLTKILAAAAGLWLLAGAPLWAEGLSRVQRAQSAVQTAKLELACDNLDCAVELLESAHQLQPYWSIPHAWLAIAYQRQGNKEKALEHYAYLQRITLEFSPARRHNPPESVELVICSEALTLWLINETRQELDLPLLRPEPRLSLAAREHSLEMRDLRYFDHLSPTRTQRTAVDRFRSVFHFLPRYVAENLARRWGTRPCLSLERMEQVHRDFMDSPGHRENTVSIKVTCLGVGIATNLQGHYWITEMFARYGS